MYEVVKEVAIDAREAVELRREFRTLDISIEVLGAALQKLAEQTAERQMDVWSDVARRLGYSDAIDGESQGVSFRVDWVGRKLLAERVPRPEEVRL
jgi:hypothetical protein